MLQILAIILILFGTAAQSVFADSPLVIDINEGLESEHFETGDVDKTTTSSFVQTIYREDIKSTQVSLAAVIEKKAGIKIRQTGGIGSFSQVSIRGKSADQVMVYLDGVLLNDASGGGIDLSLIPLNEVEAIEIYKDIIPIEFAEVSNGGVINIKTLRHKEKKSVRLSQMAGSFKTFKSDIIAQHAKKNWQTIFSANYLESKNNFMFVNERAPFSTTNEENIEQRNNNEIFQKNFILKLKQSLGSDQALQYQLGYLDKIKYLPAINNNNLTNTNLAYENSDLKVKYIDDSFYLPGIKFHFSANRSRKVTIYDDRSDGLGLQTEHIKFVSDALDSQLYFNYSTHRFQLISNSIITRETLNISDLLENIGGRKNQRLSLVTGIQANLFYQNKKLILSPAIRFQKTRDELNGLVVTRQGAVEDSSSVYETFSPQFGLRYALNDDAILKLNMAKYYRLPNYIELFGSQGYIGSNEELLPEQGVNSDLGLELSVYPKESFLTYLNWQAAIFYSQIKNEIIYSFNSRGEGRPENSGKSFIQGVESQILVELFYDLELLNSITYQVPYNKTESGRKRYLPGRPLFSTSTKASFQFLAYQLYLEHVLEKEFYFDSEERLPADTKRLLNTGWAFQSRQFSFNVAINNLTDERFKDYYFQPSPGRSLQVSVDIELI